MAVRADKASNIVIEAENGDLPKLKTVLQKFPLKVDTMHNGHTALQAAARKGHLEIIKHLVREHADVNFCDIEDRTPLHYAVNGDQPAAVDLLLKLGARMDEENSDYLTAPQVAFKNNYSHCVRIFLEKDQNVKLKSGNNTQPSWSGPSTEVSSHEDVESENNSQSTPTQKCIYCDAATVPLITFKPCGCKVSCFKCSSKVACKKCGDEVKEVSFENNSEEYKQFIEEYEKMEQEIESLNEDKLCCICKDKPKDCTLMCGHVFCRKCVRTWKNPTPNDKGQDIWKCFHCNKPSRFLKIYP